MQDARDHRHAAPLLDRLRDAHQRRATGVFEYELRGRIVRLFLREGEVLLPGDNALAEMARSLASAGPGAAWESLLLRVAERLADEAGVSSARMRPLDQLPEAAAGPLPTRALLRRAYGLAGAATVESPEQLIAELPAEDPAGSPACWSPEEQWVIERLRSPRTTGEISRGCPFPAETLRRVIAGLRGVGVVHVRGQSTVLPQDSGLLKLVELMRARIGASLRERPLGLLDDALQRHLEEVLKQRGDVDHYALLGLGPESDESEIGAAFERFARDVHPSHADRPGVRVPRHDLETLFERAVAAMRTLGDPALRAEYDTLHEIARPDLKDSSDRRAEVGELARREFDRARYEERNGDLHTALVLYERAASLAPRAEHWLALARLQAKNRSWSSRALESFRRALELDPGAASEIRYEMGEVLERAGKMDEAVSFYQNAAESGGGNEKARAALRRLAASGHGTSRDRSGGLSRLFRRE